MSSRSPDSIALMTRALARGDESAWVEFHANYYDFVYHASLRLARNDDLAKEVAQESLLRMVRHMKTFKSQKYLENWMHCLIRCVYIDGVRKSSRRSLLHEKWMHWQEHHRPDPMAEAMQGERITDLLSCLTADDRQLVTDFYIEQMSQSELADSLGTTRKAIESRLGRIRASLRLHQSS